MVMDYVEGPTLAQYIRTTSRTGNYPPPNEIVQLFVSISRAIDYAHQQGMIHRDIKPSNILLDQRYKTHNPMGEPVLTDFGIAKLIGASSGTMSGVWLGTPLYISPEQAQGQPGNERSDIYSLGVILYEMCTGVTPFQGENIPALLMQQVHAMPTPPALINPKIPPALAMVIMRGMAKDPAMRFSSASFMTAALADALSIPIPPDMSRPLYAVDAMSSPTYLSQPHNQPQAMESVPPLSSPVSPVPGTQLAVNAAPGMAQNPVAQVKQP
jgi:serine/threonine protein kinase